jgi:transglutaminase-like putative cysteine protease
MPHNRPMTNPSSRTVSADIDLDVTAPGQVIFQIAVVKAAGLTVDEQFDLTLDGASVPVREVVGVTGSRFHVAEPANGKLLLSYHATVTGRAEPPEILDYELIEYLRPSRYAESDKLAAIAFNEFGAVSDAEELLGAVAAWVGGHLRYVAGSSDPIDGSVDTYLLGQGVCRDYAHLVVAFLRARNIPARLVAVYAPGLSPMDFHAVAEAFVNGAWRVVDGTLLAPRSSLLRIATGRDAADTAFLDNFGGAITFNNATVSATVEGHLPADDPRTLVTLG